MPEDKETTEDIDWLAVTNNQERAFVDLFSRHDIDKDLLIQYPFTMFDEDNREMPDVENLTFNDAAVFGDTVTSRLIGANMTTTVEGEGLKDKDTTFIEDFIRDLILLFDESLQPRGINSLLSWDIDQLSFRGSVAARLDLQPDEDGLAKNPIVPMDVRYLIYEYGVKGLKWFRYQTFRSADKIGEQYGIVVDPGGSVISDIWDDKDEYIFIGKSLEKTIPHDYGFVPAVIQLAPTGLSFMDADRILYSGESIFSKSRKLFKEKNHLASILKTLTVMSFLGGLQYESSDPANEVKPDIPPFGKKFVAPVEKGTKGYFNMPINDVRNATQILYQAINEALIKATLPPVSFGLLEFPLESGIGMSILKEAEDSVYLPRLQGLFQYRRRLYRMVFKQYIDQKMNVKMGELGFQKNYPWKELDKEFSLKIIFDMTSPKQNMVNINSAAAVGDILSEDTKMRDYLKVEDVGAENAKKWAEKARLVSPALQKKEMIAGLLETGDITGANLLAAELGIDIDNIMDGVAPQPTELAARVPPKQFMPMLGGTQGVKDGN